MINIMSGQAAVTSTPNNVPQKKDETKLSSQKSVSIDKDSESLILKNNSLREDEVSFQTQRDEQEKGDNPDKVDYQKEALSKLMESLRKEYIERNHYIDEDTQISVLQIINTDTDRVIGQYPSDLYLSLLTKVREAQKQLVNEVI